MTWHKVSDKAPPKENSPWLMFMASELSGSSTRARWKNGYWVAADGGLWVKGREVADYYLWTLAPGQEPAEVESGAVLAAAHRAIEALGDIAAACTAEAPHDQIREMARAAIIDLGSTESVPGEEPAEAAPDEDSVEVRYAIAVDRNGCASVAGGTGVSDVEMEELAVHSSDLDHVRLQVHFGTTRVPLPRPVEVRGEVEEVDS